MADGNRLKPDWIGLRGPLAGAYIGLWVLALWLLAFPPPAIPDWRAYPDIRFTPKAHVELASQGLAWKVGVLDLICTAEGELRIGYRARLPGPRREASSGSPGPWGPFEAWLFIEGGRRLQLSATQLDVASVDTIITAPLSDTQIERMVRWSGQPGFRSLSFIALDSGTRFRVRASTSEIEALVQECAGPVQ